MEQPQVPTFNQRTTWQSDDDLRIKGHQLQVITNLANLFRPLVVAADQIVQQAVMDGKAITEFVDENGKVVESDLMKQIYNSLQKANTVAPIPPVSGS